MNWKKHSADIRVEYEWKDYSGRLNCNTITDTVHSAFPSCLAGNILAYLKGVAQGARVTRVMRVDTKYNFDMDYIMSDPDDQMPEETDPAELEERTY